MRSLVIQSHRKPFPHPWLSVCMDSVRKWADARSFEYRFIGDEIFLPIDELIASRYKHRKLILSDLARLYALQAGLKNHFDQVIWLDSDTLILNSEHFLPVPGELVVGREHWVDQDQSGKYRVYTKVHNAFLSVARGSFSLPFCIGVAERLLSTTTGKVPDQFIGPKLLTALHNIVKFDVQETAAVLSPKVIKDLIAGGGDAYELFKGRSKVAPHAVNLCASSVDRRELSDRDMLAVIQELASWSW